MKHSSRNETKQNNIIEKLILVTPQYIQWTNQTVFHQNLMENSIVLKRVKVVNGTLEIWNNNNQAFKYCMKCYSSSFSYFPATDGQHLYLHSLNARCLVREYGSLENSPQHITATIVEKESVFVTEVQHSIESIALNDG